MATWPHNKDIIGPPEPIVFKCGGCGKPITTYWAAGHRGLEEGDYCLLGDVVFHDACADRYIESFEGVLSGDKRCD